jgi:hypothetical protein
VIVYFDNHKDQALKSGFCEAGGKNPTWEKEFKLSVAGTQQTLKIDILHKGLLSDNFIGRASIGLSQLNELAMIGSPQWYRTGRGDGDKTPAGDIMLSAKLVNASSGSVSTNSTTSTTVQQQQQTPLKPAPVLANQQQPQMLNTTSAPMMMYPQQPMMMQMQQPMMMNAVPMQYNPQVMFMAQPTIQTTNLPMSSQHSYQPAMQHQFFWSTPAAPTDSQPPVQLPPGFGVQQAQQLYVLPNNNNHHQANNHNQINNNTGKQQQMQVQQPQHSQTHIVSQPMMNSQQPYMMAIPQYGSSITSQSSGNQAQPALATQTLSSQQQSSVQQQQQQPINHMSQVNYAQQPVAAYPVNYQYQMPQTQYYSQPAVQFHQYPGTK